MSGLELISFKAATHKVKVLQFHVTQPWIAMADKNQQLTIWDWSNDQVMYECQLGVAEDRVLQEAMLHRLVEKDPSYYGPIASTGMPLQKAVAPGSVRALAFLDTETCFWQLELQQQRQYRTASAAEIPYLGRVRGLKGRRWLVAACETKITLLDVLAGIWREVPRALLDGRAPTALAFLYTHSPALLGYKASEVEGPTVIAPVMAVGSTSGVIYLITVSNLQVYAKLVGHKVPVTKLLPLGSKEPGGPDLLLSAAQDGSLSLWDPSRNLPKGPDKEVAPVGTFKAHEGEVYAMDYFQGLGQGGLPGPLCIITSGADKKVAVWEVGKWKELAKHKVLNKGAVEALGFSPRGAAACGLEHNVLFISGEAPSIWGMTLQLPAGSRHLTVTPLLDLEALLPPGLKKIPKLYEMAVHPLRPHLLAVGCNTGVALLSFDPHAQPPVCAVPLIDPVPADLDEDTAAAGPRPSDAFRGCQYLLASDKILYHVYARPSWKGEGAARQVAVDVLGRKSVLTYQPHNGHAEVRISSDGAYASIVWPLDREYTILAATGATGWTAVSSGSGVAVAWALSGPTFAVLHIPQAQAVTASKKGRWGRGRVDKAESQMQAAVAAAEAAARASTAVQVFTVVVEEKGGPSVNLLCENVVMGSDLPVALHGGALLGVVLEPSGPKSGSVTKASKMMTFYSWTSFSAVGEALPQPKVVAWEPEVTAAALAYDDSLVLCRTQPAFTAFTTLSVPEASSMVWQRHVLWVATASTVYCIFVAAGADVAAPYAEIVKVASLGGGVVSQMAAVADASASLPSETLRCAGPVSIVGMRMGALWLITATGQPFLIQISHPGLRARLLSANGSSAAARALAERALPRQHHDELAAFMTVMDPRAASTDAASLSGLSVRAEAGLAAAGGQLRRALHALDAAAQGATDRALLNTFPRWRHRMANAPVSEDWRTPPLPPNSPLHKPREAPDITAELLSLNLDESGEPNEDIDWDAPLKAALAEGAPPPRPPGDPGPAEGAVSRSLAEGPVTDTVTAEEAARIAELAPEALALSSVAYNSGIRDVAVGALRILLRGASALPWETIQNVLLRAARLDMNAELDAFAAGVASRQVEAPPDLASLTASLVDSPPLAKAVLDSAGLMAQSTVYTYAWRSGSGLQATQAWSSALSSVAAPGVRVNVAPPT